MIRPGPVPFDIAAALAPEPAADPGAIRAWAVSQSFLPKAIKESELPGADVTGTFSRIAAEPTGLVELHRHVRMPEKSRQTAAVARVNVRAAAAGTYAFDLGFSDVATVFVNGRPLFRGEGSYSYDRPRREGLIGYDQARLYLPLTAGDNEVAIVIADGFGGWGLMGRFPSPAGLTIEAR